MLCLVGCGNTNSNAIEELENKINELDGYNMTGTLEIYRNEDKYTYDVDSSYSKSDLYKVTLVNKNNNHEQIILKNEDGVYVITPSLNKSFKFQSEWPYNNSQIYLLHLLFLVPMYCPRGGAAFPVFYNPVEIISVRWYIIPCKQ